MKTTLDEIAKAMGYTDKSERKDYHAYGEVKSINRDGSYQVSLNGSDTTVRCARLCGAKVGDTVLTTILKNGYVVATSCVGGDTDAVDAQESAQSAYDEAQIAVKKITATEGNILVLSGDLAQYKEIVAGQFTAQSGRIDILSGDLASYKEVVTEKFTSNEALIGTIAGDLANYKVVIAQQFTAVDGEFEAIKSDTAKFQTTITNRLEANEVEVGEISGQLASFVSGDFGILSASVADLRTLLFGSATGTTITTDFSNSVVSHIGAAQIDSGMIKDLAFEKITGFEVNTTNLIIRSEDGRSQWKDNTILIKDSTRPRVQIGKDASGDYSMYVWDKDGALMFDALGLTESGIQREIIRDDMVSQDAAIDAGKLDLVSLFREVNGNIEKLETGKLKFDGKTLELYLGSMSDTVTDQGQLLCSQGTQLIAVQGAIESRIWQQDIDTSVGDAEKNMNTKYSTLEQSLNGFKVNVGETYSTKTETAAVGDKANQALSSSQANASDLAAYITNTNSELENMQGQIDGSIMTWFYQVAPTNSNLPAKDWTTTELKNTHLGDLYYDTITGYCYRWQVQNNVYSWNRITDVDVTKALSDAHAAQESADEKMRVFVTTPAPPYDVGDLWSQGAGGDLMRCKTTKTEAQSYAAADWEKAVKYTDDTKANQAINKTAELTVGLDGIASRVGVTENNIRGLDDKFGNYSTTSQMNSAIEQTAKDITSTVSATYTKKADFNALEVGDRNLLLESGGAYVSDLYAIHDYYFCDEAPVEGETYTIVMKATLAEGKSSFAAYNSGGSVSECSFYPADQTGGIYKKSFAWKTGAAANTFLRIYQMPSSVVATSTIEWVKLVKGNRASSAWTPAPEDVDENIGMAQDTAADALAAVETAESTIQQLADSISQLIVGKDGQSLMKQTEDGWVFDMKDILGDLDAVTDNVSDLSEGIGGLQDGVGVLQEMVAPLTDLNSYVAIDKDENGNPLIELGNGDSDFKVRITNHDIKFMEGQDAPAYISNQKLNIKKAVVEDELQFGGFVWTERANGNMGLIWKGES